MFGEAGYGALVLGATVTDGASVAALLASMLWSPLAGLVGAVVGGVISLVSGLALALSAHGVLGRISRARLVTGGAAAAVPLAVVLNLGRLQPWWQYLIATGIATAAVAAAVLMTPRILNGPPPAGKWQPGTRPAAQAPATRSEQ